MSCKSVIDFVRLPVLNLTCWRSLGLGYYSLLQRHPVALTPSPSSSSLSSRPCRLYFSLRLCQFQYFFLCPKAARQTIIHGINSFRCRQSCMTDLLMTRGLVEINIVISYVFTSHLELAVTEWNCIRNSAVPMRHINFSLIVLLIYGTIYLSSRPLPQCCCF